MGMTKSQTIEKCLEMVLAMKRICSRGNRSEVPDDGMENTYDMWDEMQRNLRDMLRDMRYGTGRAYADGRD